VAVCVCGCSGESSLLGAVEKATAEAEKHGDRSEKLSALVAEAKGMIEQAKTKQAERAKAAAAVTAAAEAAEAAERLHDEEELAALTLRVQQVQARLGSSVVPPADAEETMCVVCFDAPKDHILVPCYHLCVCEACANLLTQMDKPTCPICRAAIRQTNKVFQS
jgi:transcription elongation GreA/GreB family factor